MIVGLSTLDRSVLCARRVSVLVIGGSRIAMSEWCYDGSGLRAPWYRTGRRFGLKEGRDGMDEVECSEAKRAVCEGRMGRVPGRKKEEGAVPAADRVSNRTAHGGALWMGSDED